MNDEERREHAKLLAAERRHQHNIQLIKKRGARLAAQQAQSGRGDFDTNGNGGEHAAGASPGPATRSAEQIEAVLATRELESPRGLEAGSSTALCPTCGQALLRHGASSDFLQLLSSLRLDDGEDLNILQVNVRSFARGRM